MLKKKLLLPLALGLVLTLTACATDDVEPDETPPPPGPPVEEIEDVEGEEPVEEIPGEDIDDEEVNP